VVDAFVVVSVVKEEVVGEIGESVGRDAAADEVTAAQAGDEAAMATNLIGSLLPSWAG